MTILMPVDSMADGDLILSFARDYKWPEGARFCVMHVIGRVASDEEYAAEEEKAQQLLAEITAKIQSLLPSADITSSIHSGDAALEIIEKATKLKAKMIVMGFRVRTDIRSCMAGSVSRSVAVQAPCSVVVIRPQPEECADDVSSEEGRVECGV